MSDACDFPRAETAPFMGNDGAAAAAAAAAAGSSNCSSSRASTPVSTQSSQAWESDESQGDGSSRPNTSSENKKKKKSSSSSNNNNKGRAIYVVARFRPENALEMEKGGNNAIDYHPDGCKVSVSLDLEKVGTETHDFKFEKILPPSTEQEEVYSHVGRPIVDALMDGINCSCLSYGATGSGKTFTMNGALNAKNVLVAQPGIMPRVMNDLFDRIDSISDTHDCVFNFSFVELYMERLRDLLVYLPLGRNRLSKVLSGDNDDKNKKKAPGNIEAGDDAYVPKDIALTMKTDEGPPPGQVDRWRQMCAFGERAADENAALEIRDSGKGLYITNCTSIWVQSAADAMNVVSRGMLYRTTATTKQNAQSSRSHAILVCTLITKDRVSLVQTQAQLYLVDLAGSERVSKSETEGLLLEEAKSINLSLFGLGQVINALAERASKKGMAGSHVPYRDSKLTRLLENSLGGNALTFIVCCCSPSSYNAGETISTLRFGAKSSLVKTQPRRNENLTVEELTFLLDKSKQEIDQHKATIQMLKMQLAAKNNNNNNNNSGGKPARGSPASAFQGVSPSSPPSSPMSPWQMAIANEKHARLVDIVRGLLTCPITQKFMREPVICMDSYTCEKEAIWNYLKDNEMRSPITNQRVLMSTLIPNVTIKAIANIVREENLLDLNVDQVEKYQSPWFAWPVVWNVVAFMSVDQRLSLATINSQFASCIYNKDMWLEPIHKMLASAPLELQAHVKKANLPAHKVYVLLKRNEANPAKAAVQLQRYIIQPNIGIQLFSSTLQQNKERFGPKAGNKQAK